MRHRIDKKKLNRKQDHRSLLYKNLVTSFAKNGKLTTTLAKGKIIQPRIDALISNTTRQSLDSRRRLYAYFTEKNVASKFFDEVSLLGDRKSGFTRLTKLGPRRGDGAEMARVEWAFVFPKKDSSAKKERVQETVKLESKKSEKKATVKEVSAKYTPSP